VDGSGCMEMDVDTDTDLQDSLYDISNISFSCYVLGMNARFLT